MSEYRDIPDTLSELDWDSEISQESSYTILPEGEYPFSVASFERGYHNGSDKLPPCNKAILTIEIDGGKLGKSTVKHNLFISRRTEGLLCEFFISIGLKKHGEPLRMNWAAVPGAKGRCKVGIRTYNGNEYNEIKRFLEPTAAPAPAVGFAPPSFK